MPDSMAGKISAAMASSNTTVIINSTSVRLRLWFIGRASKWNQDRSAAALHFSWLDKNTTVRSAAAFGVGRSWDIASFIGTIVITAFETIEIADVIGGPLLAVRAHRDNVVQTFAALAGVAINQLMIPDIGKRI